MIKLSIQTLLAGALLASTAQGANLVPVYLDDPGEGFFSTAAPNPLSQQDGNPGDTLGEQRRWAFEKALEFWALRIQSSVTIQVAGEMNPLFCAFSSVALGFAGPLSIATFGSPGAIPHPIPNTWYVGALVNRFTATDNFSATDIGSEFNSDLDTGCFGGGVWYYALGTPFDGRPSFFETAVHEIGHGLGFLTLVDSVTGARLQNTNDVYMVFLEDHSLVKTWPNLTDAQRMASSTDDNDLHWVGTDVNGSLDILSGGSSNGHAKMYAPATLQEASSVSHWDTDVVDMDNLGDIMVPIATDNQKLLVSDDLLHDIGWNDVPANNCAFAIDRRIVTATLASNNNQNACVSVTFDGAVIDSGATNALAGQQIIMQNGFTVGAGATFSAATDPFIGL